ncbi:MAG: trypsin-like peptidase domain-containing protein, partial [Phycisphaerales bacterium]
WGLVRLDRAVKGVTPLALRRTGQVADGQPVLMVGYPWGVPRKYAAGAIVRENAESTYFQANVDAYRGNSGSPVINLDSMVVDGLLVRGIPTFAEDVLAGCDRSSPCPDTGCLEEGVAQWDDVTRATNFSSAVPSFEVYLGTAPDQLEVVATAVVVPRYLPPPLRKDAVYYWRVVARNIDGQVTGPLWSFRTTPVPAPGD